MPSPSRSAGTAVTQSFCVQLGAPSMTGVGDGAAAIVTGACMKSSSSIWVPFVPPMPRPAMYSSRTGDSVRTPCPSGLYPSDSVCGLP